MRNSRLAVAFAPWIFFKAELKSNKKNSSVVAKKPGPVLMAESLFYGGKGFLFVFCFLWPFMIEFYP